MVLHKDKKVYFVSDSHFGVPDYASSLVREKLLVKWLDTIKGDAAEIYLLGDIFDYWFEYKSVVPKGFVRFFGKIAELSDAGIPIYYFTGNHDMWIFGYFEKELGVKIYRKPIEKTINGKLFFIGHGDGLGPGDYGYKFIKWLFSVKLLQAMYSFVHPGLGMSVFLFFSKKSRTASGPKDAVFRGEAKERHLAFCREMLTKKKYNYFVFGHRHLPLQMQLAPDSYYISTGDWLKSFSYCVFDGNQMHLLSINESE